VERAVLTPHQRDMAQTLRRLMAAFRDVRDLVDVGAYATGSDPVVDLAIRLRPDIDNFLRQPPEQVVPVHDSWAALGAMLGVKGDG
jgi:flagellum-specific ATP synthase